MSLDPGLSENLAYVWHCKEREILWENCFISEEGIICHMSEGPSRGLSGGPSGGSSGCRLGVVWVSSGCRLGVRPWVQTSSCIYWHKCSKIFQKLLLYR